MKFGWINLFGAAVVILMLIPNILFAVKFKGEENLCKNKAMNVIEQTGRYACIILMWMPLLVWEFGFASVARMLIYAGGNTALLAAYLIVFAVYLRKRSKGRAVALAVLPVCIFLLSGILLRHWLLAAFAILFGTGHIYVTAVNTKGIKD